MGVTVPYYKYFTWNEYLNYNDRDYLDGNVVCMVDSYEGVLRRWASNALDFADPVYYNYPTKIGNGTSCASMFNKFSYFNQPVKIPNTVTSCVNMFYNCSRFNQPVTLANKAISCAGMFCGCTNLNSPITIPNKKITCTNMFYNCGNGFQQDITIPSAVVACQNMFSSAGYLNPLPKNIYINCVGRTAEPNLQLLLGVYRNANSPQANVFCNNKVCKMIDFAALGYYMFFYDLALYMFTEAFIQKNDMLLKQYLTGKYDFWIEKICSIPCMLM